MNKQIFAPVLTARFSSGNGYYCYFSSAIFPENRNRIYYGEDVSYSLVVTMSDLENRYFKNA